MSNQLFANLGTSAVNLIQKSQIIEGTIAFAGSYGNPESLNWANIISGNGYNQANPALNQGVGGNSSALVTTFAASSGVITATAANRFSVGQKVTFVGNTSTLGLLLNGTTAVVATASGTQFTFSSALTGSGTGETGMAVSGGLIYALGLTSNPITASVTSLAVSGGVITVTAANNYVAGANVTFANLTTVLGLLMNGTNFTVQSASQTAFKLASSLTGAAGADTGTATGRNPPRPYDVTFWSSNASGYSYAWQENNENLVIQQGAASASNPNAPIGTGALPAGVTGDIVHYQAFFLKDR